MGNLMPCIVEGRIRYEEIFPHAFGESERNVGYEALLYIGADILAIAFTGMVRMFEFLNGIDEGRF